jgi:hypothetical protein
MEKLERIFNGENLNLPSENGIDYQTDLGRVVTRCPNRKSEK